MEKIWHFALHNVMRKNPEDNILLMSEPALNPTESREKTTKILFETFGIPALCLSAQSELSLFSMGRTSGTVIEIGEGVCNTVPIFKGSHVPQATYSLNISGRELSHYLAKLLTKRYTKNTNFTIDVVQDIKERCCYVTSDVEMELKHLESAVVEKSYEMPNGEYIHLGEERFRCSEILFDPSLIGLNEPGVHLNLHKSYLKCAEDYKITSDIVLLSGGTTMLDGLQERLTKELSILEPKNRMRILVPPERKYSPWIGGSVLASLSIFQDMCITKQDYYEYGAPLVHNRCRFRES
eukprot:TRINITY_DN2785_c0_g1_i6.p1 TRINITY_DN2785_c0_g1~~TRINITY_DN2785_c0_g1_i6.p1  ORF type:complete len:295 (+),score=2.62 TRINITY_DN2785_c0_g1_i6:961-1845(+)